MIGTPFAGWTKITVGEYSISASYLTDVPFQLLDAFIKVFIHGEEPIAVKFDLEGSYAYLLLNHFDSYLIISRDNVYVTQEIIETKQLAKELLLEIRKDIDEWARWDVCFCEDEKEEAKKEILQRKEQLLNKCEYLECHVGKEN